MVVLSCCCTTAEYSYTCCSSCRNTQSNNRIVLSWIRQCPIIFIRRDSRIQKHIPTTISSSSSSMSSVAVGGVMKISQYKQQQRRKSSIRMYSDHWNDDSHTNFHISSRQQRPYRVSHSTYKQRQRQRLLLLMDRNNRNKIYMSKEDNENDMNRNRYSIQSDNNSNNPIRPIVRVVAAVPILLLLLLLLSLSWGSTMNQNMSLPVVGCTTIILFLILRTIATPLIQSSIDDDVSTMLLLNNKNDDSNDDMDEEEVEVIPLQWQIDGTILLLSYCISALLIPSSNLPTTTFWNGNDDNNTMEVATIVAFTILSLIGVYYGINNYVVRPILEQEEELTALSFTESLFNQWDQKFLQDARNNTTTVRNII